MDSDEISSEYHSKITHSPADTLSGIIHLSRWREHVPLVLLTIMGPMAAYSHNNTHLDWRLLLITLANFLAVAFAFMINDIEDAPDDKRDPASAARNPVANGLLNERTAWAASGCTAGLALLLYFWGGSWVLLVGAFHLALAFFYSWRPVRLKSSTIGLDVLSHSLMLGGLLPLAGYLVYSSQLYPGIVWIVVAASLGSAYGQFYNQLRDFHTDQSAGIVNLSIRLGKNVARVLMYSSAFTSIGTAVLASLMLRFPPWGLTATLTAILLGLSSVFFIHTDASGKPPADFTGRFQKAFWISLASLISLWLLWGLGWI